MTDQELHNRITINPKVMVGKAVIRGTRLTVEFILNLLAHGAIMDEIIKEYQGLKVEDIRPPSGGGKDSLPDGCGWKVFVVR